MKKILKRLIFTPCYFNNSIELLGREIPIGFINELRTSKPDIVVVNEYGESCWFSIVYRLFAKKKFKIISICDDSLDIFKNGGGLHSIARRIACRHIDGVILCNNKVEDIYNKRYPNLKSYVMPIIQDEKAFLANQKTIKNEALKLISKEKLIGKRMFLFVGRISPEKNIIYLIRSFINEHDRSHENVLYIIGDSIEKNKQYDNYIDEYIKHKDATSYIRKIGRREGEELKVWLMAAQVLVVPSIREPFGAVTNEALLCGNYVMISSIAGATCLIDDTNGEIIDVNNKSINFEFINSRVPVLEDSYVRNKASKMKHSYKKYISSLIDWIEKI